METKLVKHIRYDDVRQDIWYQGSLKLFEDCDLKEMPWCELNAAYPLTMTKFGNVAIRSPLTNDQILVAMILEHGMDFSNGKMATTGRLIVLWVGKEGDSFNRDLLVKESIQFRNKWGGKALNNNFYKWARPIVGQAVRSLKGKVF